MFRQRAVIGLLVPRHLDALLMRPELVVKRKFVRCNLQKEGNLVMSRFKWNEETKSSVCVQMPLDRADGRHRPECNYRLELPFWE